MGNGLIPPGGSDGEPRPLDDGTLPRIPMPPPAAIGLDARSGTPKQTQQSMADRIVSFARQLRGQRVGDGQCFALADRALGAAGAKSASDYGTVTADADYVWGAVTSLSDVRPGDIIQFRDYQADIEIVTETPDATTTRTERHSRPHHTAIVEEVGADGVVTVLEQNAPERSPVTRNRLRFSSGTFTSGSTTTTVRVQGTIWYYRPEAK